MELIDSYAQYEMYIKKFRQNQKAVGTNLFLLPKDLKAIIEERRLYFGQTESIIRILVDEGYYYHLYYIGDLNDLSFPKVQKDVLIENIYNLKGNTEQAEILRKVCLQAGARFNKKSYQIEITENPRNILLDNEYGILKKQLNAKGLYIDFAEKKDMSQIAGLWEQYLEVYDFTYMSNHLIENMISQKEILAIKNEKKEVIASKCMSFSGVRSVGFHLVVDSVYRGVGLGKMMMYEWLFLGREKGIKICNAWVAENNLVSLSCHLKAGMKTGKISEQYILPVLC